MEDRLAATHGLYIFAPDADLVAALGQLLQRMLGHARFDIDITAGSAVLEKARGLQGLLQAHAVVDVIGHELRMGHGLHRAAHDAEADMLVALFHEGRNDGVERALSTGEHVGMLGIEIETRAAILQHKAHAFHGDARAEAGIYALNPTSDVAVFIHDGEVGCVASDRVAGVHLAVRAIGIDLGGALASVVFR